MRGLPGHLGVIAGVLLAVAPFSFAETGVVVRIGVTGTVVRVTWTADYGGSDGWVWWSSNCTGPWAASTAVPVRVGDMMECSLAALEIRHEGSNWIERYWRPAGGGGLMPEYPAAWIEAHWEYYGTSGNACFYRIGNPPMDALAEHVAALRSIAMVALGFGITVLIGHWLIMK